MSILEQNGTGSLKLCSATLYMCLFYFLLKCICTMTYCLSAESMVTNSWRVIIAHSGQHHGTGGTLGCTSSSAWLGQEPTPDQARNNHVWKIFKEDFTTVWGCPFSFRHLSPSFHVSETIWDWTTTIVMVIVKNLCAQVICSCLCVLEPM